jgi:very-short-patch-repair endonuclease
MPLFECLVQVFRCQQAEIAFVILESALRLGRLDAKGQQLLASRLPSHRELILAAGPLADSGTESLFCYRMARIGIRMQSQVEIPGVGRVDFLIGDRLVIEIDSETHHGERAKRLRDLRRDATLAGLGYIYLRFDYQMIIQEWELVASTVFAVMSRSGHLARR